MDYICFNCFLPIFFPSISLSFFIYFSLLSSVQTAPTFLLGFPCKPLKLCNLFLSRVRSEMSSCVICSSSISFSLSLIHILANFSFLFIIISIIISIITSITIIIIIISDSTDLLEKLFSKSFITID